MLKADIAERRKLIASTLKSCRKAYGIRILDLSVYSGLSTNTINILESGQAEWKIDSQISYLTAIFEMAKSSAKYQKQIKHWPGLEITNVNSFILNQHNLQK